ncbi:MAG: hypothetical protein WBB29_07935 [Geitlerinemataceae cyanobacterium]
MEERVHPIHTDRQRDGFALWAIVLVAAIVAGTLQWTQLDRLAAQADDPERAVQQERGKLTLLRRMPTLGYDNLLADWLFLRFLGYFGDELERSQTGYDLTPDYFEPIVRLDPRFLGIYPFLSMGISYYLGNPELAGQYMERGIKALSPEVNPDGYAILRFRGLDQLLLEGDIPGTIETYYRIADWFDRIGRPDSAQQFRDGAEFLAQNPDSIQPQLWGWQQVYYNAVDRRVQERAEQELLKLGAIKQEDANGNIGFVLPKPSKISK